MRNISLYDSAGPYTLDLMSDAGERARKVAAVRRFLWEHWQQRRLGTITVTGYSREGEPSTNVFFVERDPKGTWRIAVEIERRLVGRGSLSKQWLESFQYSSYALDRIEIPKNGLTPRIVIPEGEERSPDSYLLVLKDRLGKSLTEL